MHANPTLDQLQIFLAVAENGGFSAAARELNRSQSVISYAIANLEDQLEVKLFERAGTRQPQLTEAGRAVLSDARRIVAGLQDLRARAKCINQGLEPEVVAAVDVTLPNPVLVNVLKAFEARFPTVGLRLHVGALGVTADLASKGEADIGIGGGAAGFEGALTISRIGFTAMVPVAAPDHPLALAEAPVPLSVVREHPQLVITDLSERTAGSEFNVYAFRTWRLTDVGAKRALIIAGLGWGGLPETLITEDLAAGRLVRLSLEPYPASLYPLYSMHATAKPPGPAAAWLIEKFREELASCPQPHPLGTPA